MRNSLCQRNIVLRPLTNVLGAAALLSILSTGVAFAQAQPAVPAPTTAKPVEAPKGLLLPSKPTTAAPIPEQPSGGFDVDAVAASDDPANAMSLDGAGGYVQQVQTAADQRLSGLTATSVSPETASELEEMMRLKRSNLLLALKREEADLAVGLWGALYNNEHAQAWRLRQEEETEKREKAAAEDAKAREAALAASMSTQASYQAWPVVSEVNGGTAILIVPNGGEVYASAGTALPGGLKVVAVGSGGVVVEKDGNRTTLGFGTSVAVPAVVAQPTMN